MSRIGSHEKDFSFYQIIYELETLNPEMSETEINSGNVVGSCSDDENILTCFRLRVQAFLLPSYMLATCNPPNLSCHASFLRFTFVTS